MDKARSVWILSRLRNGDYFLQHVVPAPIGSWSGVRLPPDFRFTREERRRLRLDAYACARQCSENDPRQGHG